MRVDIEVSDPDIEITYITYYPDSIFIHQKEKGDSIIQRSLVTIMANREEAKQLLAALQKFLED